MNKDIQDSWIDVIFTDKNGKIWVKTKDKTVDFNTYKKLYFNTKKTIMDKFFDKSDKITYWLPILMLFVLVVFLFIKALNYFLNLLFL